MGLSSWAAQWFRQLTCGIGHRQEQPASACWPQQQEESPPATQGREHVPPSLCPFLRIQKVVAAPSGTAVPCHQPELQRVLSSQLILGISGTESGHGHPGHSIFVSRTGENQCVPSRTEEEAEMATCGQTTTK